jgi:AcrR family transcriptional regulator
MTSPGLRERKKQKTRWAIQEHALRLIAEQGYEATTVDQIAAAAEISPSTFFRYFKTKEDLIIEDEYDAVLEHGLRTLDPQTPPLEAIRAVMRTSLSAMTAQDRTKLLERTRLVYSVPALRSRALENFGKTVDLIAGLMAERTGRPAGSVEIRAFAGAVIGALSAVIALWVEGQTEADLAKIADLVDEALVYVGAGVPL